MVIGDRQQVEAFGSMCKHNPSS